MKPKGIVRNTTALLIIQISNQLLPLVTIPHLTRALGVDTYGAYAFALAITLMASIVTDFGFNLWATAEVSLHRDDRVHINKLYGTVTVIKLVLTALCIGVIFAYATFSGKPDAYTAAIYWTALAVIGLTLQPIWLFSGLEQMSYITVFVMVSRIVFIVLVFTVIRSPADLVLLVAAYGLSQVLSAILGSALLARHRYIPTRPSIDECRRVLRMAAPFFVSRLAVSSYAVGGALFLGLFSTTRNVAIYSVAEQLYRGGQALLSPIGQVMYPYMMRTRNFRTLMRATALVTVAAAAGATIAAFLGARIIQLLFGAEFADALPVLHVFLVAILFNAPSIMLGYPMLGALARVDLANRSVVIAGILQAVALLACYLMGWTTPVAVAITVLIAEVNVFILRVTWSVRTWNVMSD